MRPRTCLFVFLVAIALAFSPGKAFAAIVWDETFEGYATGSWADADGTGGWRAYGTGTDGSIVSTPTFAGTRAGQLAPHDPAQHVWNRFNTNPAVANDMVWIEFFAQNDITSWNALRIPTTNDLGSTRLQIGFLDTGDDTNANLFVSGAALGNQLSSITFADGNWYHLVAEVDLNGASSTVTLYGKAKTPGDTSPLDTSDLIPLGGNTSNVFSWNGVQIDAMVMIAGGADTVTYDNIAVYDENIIVPEPLTALLMCLGGAVVLRKKSKA